MKVSAVFGKPCSGSVSVRNAKLESPVRFENATRLTIDVSGENTAPGPYPAMVSVGDVTFHLRDVNAAHPVWFPERSFAVLPENDPRSYADVERDIRARHLLSERDRFDAEPEESYENASLHDRCNVSPTWLGLGRDVRGFWIDFDRSETDAPLNRDLRSWGNIRPMAHSHGRSPSPETLDPIIIRFSIGPGAHCRPSIARWLEDGSLPILHSVQDELSIQYRLTGFASMESGPVSAENLKGTDCETYYAFCAWGACKIPEDRKARLKASIDNAVDEVILIMRIEAVNTGNAPAYAFFSAGLPAFKNWAHDVLRTVDFPHTFENGTAFFRDFGGRAACMTLIDGKPMHTKELSVLVMPGEKVVMDLIVPNSPLSNQRIGKLAAFDYEAHYNAARSFWKSKLDSAGRIEYPEKMLTERFGAGLLHLDLCTGGLEKGGELAAAVGFPYGPIGSESAPVIQFYDSCGWHDVAERCLDFFLNRQREDGFVNVYSNYQNEMGPFLWTCGEHFRYTHDMAWLHRVAPCLMKSCDFLLAWRDENKTDECRMNGCYGLQKGKVDDPDDFFHSFYLNAGSWAGVKSMSECLAEWNPEYAQKLVSECEAWREDIIAALRTARARSPLMPIGDGSWAPHVPPWTEYTGDPAYHADGGDWSSHGTILYRVLCNPPVYCGIFGVMDCDSEDMSLILKTNGHPHTRENAGHVQPYYLRHDFAHLRRGETKAFLRMFYHQMAGMQDHETYAVGEYFSGSSHSPHKTHEEGWMLLQMRWMMYMENGSALELFKGIPRRWLKAGAGPLRIAGMKSAFGRVDAEAVVAGGKIECRFDVEREVGEVRIRLPHPEGAKALRCVGGDYDPKCETVVIRGTRSGRVSLEFAKD